MEGKESTPATTEKSLKEVVVVQEEGSGIVPPLAERHPRLTEIIVVQEEGSGDGGESSTGIIRRLILEYNRFVGVINLIPQNIYNGTMSTSKSISEKLFEYADLTTVKSSPPKEGEEAAGDPVLDEKHLDYLDLLRLKNPDAYKKLASFAQGVQPRQPNALSLTAAYIETNIETLKLL
jgi:hypothetical protein